MQRCCSAVSAIATNTSWMSRSNASSLSNGIERGHGPQYGLQHVLPLRARVGGASRVDRHRGRGRQPGERVHAQVLLADQPRAHRIEDSPRGVAAALGQRTDEQPPVRIEALAAAAPDLALGRLWIQQEHVEVLAQSIVFSDDSGLPFTTIAQSRYRNSI